MPLQATSGAASYDAFGGGAATAANYIEDVFQTWLYTGNGSTQTITNGVDLAGKGGLVWLKRRDAVSNHNLFDTARGATKKLYSDLTNAEFTDVTSLTSFNSNGFSLGLDGGGNANGGTYASWTFREQEKFFDVVTYTGNGSGARNISHNLNSAPGCIIVKCTSTTSNWMVWHRSISGQNNLYLNATDGTSTVASDPISVPGFPSSLSTTEFTVSTGTDSCNDNGATYVAYLFAHNAGGFGLSGTDNVITCGSFSGASEAASVNLGWEPQWIMVKRTDSSGSWQMYDNMRGMFAPTQAGAMLFANSSGAEIFPNGNVPFINSTGFFWDGVNNFVASGTPSYIYIAIRRGPMRTPTTGTSVFSPNNGVTTSAFNVGFPNDWALEKRPNATFDWYVGTRLTGNDRYLVTNSTGAEQANSSWVFNGNTNFFTQLNDNPALVYSYRRAPGFMDVVCYTGTGVSGQTFNHNLSVVPELMIVKGRNQASTNWAVYSSSISNTLTLYLNATLGQSSGASYWNSTTPTSSVFTVGNNSDTNTNTYTYVAYLFASCPGVSKVGSYTGTGTTQTINCGFTAGSRFVMIKRTDSTGDWYVWDSARGIVAGNDPYLLLNSTAAEVTSTDFVDTAATGFELSSTAPAALNANGGTYIFLAIA